MSLLVVVFGALLAFAGGAHVSVPPKDTVVEVGTNVTLTCETVIPDHESTDYLEWKEYISSPTGLTIFNSFDDQTISKPGKYEIHGEYNLLVRSVSLEDGGMYSCKLTWAETTANNADLIVIGKPELIMEDMKYGQNVTVICKVKFGARRPDDLDAPKIPHIRLRYDDRIVQGGDEVLIPGKPGDPDTPASHVYDPSIITYTTHVVAQGDHDGDNLTCEVYTQDPEFVISVTKTVDVKYPVTTITIEPRQPTYEVGDVITCRADGNPPPQTTWSAISPANPVPTTPDALQITEGMVGEQTWRCTARNVLDQVAEISETYTFTVLEPKDPSGGGGGAEKVGVSVATAILTFALAYTLH